MSNHFSFENSIFYVKPLFLNNMSISQISQMKCLNCQKFTCDMLKFKCCNKFCCKYCKDNPHLCIKFKKLTPLSQEDLILIKKTEFSCCYYLSGCKKPILYEDISTHVKNCNFKYFIPDDKIEISINNKKFENLIKNKEIEKYLCIFCHQVPKNLFLTNCCLRSICSYCGYTNKINKNCHCDNNSNKDKILFTIINPVDIIIEEFNKQNIFQCSNQKCCFIGNQIQLSKHVYECVESYLYNKININIEKETISEFYNYDFCSLKEISTTNYLNNCESQNIKKFPKNIFIRSILKLSNNLIAIGAGFGEIDCWEDQTNSRVWCTKEHCGIIYSIINLDENHFISGEHSENGTVIIWQYSDKEAILKKKVNLQNKGVWSLCMVGKDIVACGMENSSILIWDIYNKFMFKGREDCQKRKLKENKKQINLNESLVNIKNKINIHSGYVKCLFYTNHNDLLFSGGSDSKIITTKISNCGFSSTENFNIEHKGIIMSICRFENDYIVSSDDLGIIKIWNINNKESQKTINVHTNAVSRLIYYEPKIIMSSSLDKTIKYINVDENFSCSVLKTISTKEPIWDMISFQSYKSFTVISYNSSLITTYSNN